SRRGGLASSLRDAGPFLFVPFLLGPLIAFCSCDGRVKSKGDASLPVRDKKGPFRPPPTPDGLSYVSILSSPYVIPPDLGIREHLRDQLRAQPSPLVYFVGTLAQEACISPGNR